MPFITSEDKIDKKNVERQKNGRTNRNHYQPRILCPSNHIEARLAELGVGHA